ncbi:MAG: toll/interleukin-1 receptor domain-containing protein [Thermoplasmatales archaeon]|nr:MAG: toll/interleukin-1 receptor domain-containing protein [Thermoplasmatales archaeon]
MVSPIQNFSSDNHQLEKENLFISYATEDHALADWLALKLASEGYNVWYDRIKLLGGESYPRDITSAISSRTFRFLFLLSRSSIKKDNPLKELTLATNISRESKTDFVIPLKVDDLKPSELNFLASDIVYIPFNRGWYEGLALLLDKLEKIKTPKNIETSRSSLYSWISKEQAPAKRKERIWSNLIEITNVPKYLNCYEKRDFFEHKINQDKWAFYKWNEKILSFGPPPNQQESLRELTRIDYLNTSGEEKIEYEKIMKSLILKQIEIFSLSKGMELGGFKKNILHFPMGLFPGDKLKYTNNNNRRTYVQVAGERRFRKFSEGHYFQDSSRYHLTLNFKVLPGDGDRPVVAIKLGLYMTDLSNVPLPAKTANARRKAICKNWWNREWLSRLIAVTKWLSNESDQLVLLESENGNITMNTRLLSYISEFGIRENKKEITEDEFNILEEEEENYDFENP